MEAFGRSTHLIDALDEDASELCRASDTGKILMMKKHVFRPATLEGAVLFKLAQVRRGPIFVTDSFIEMIKASGLTGLTFKRLWPHRIGDEHRWR
jgi:hypothetical protein